MMKVRCLQVSKPRLKAVQRPRVNDDWQHCCRWCHYYCYSGDPTEGYKCYNKEVNKNAMYGFNIYSVAENGYLSQALEEGLNNQRLVDKFMCAVMDKLDEWKISGKRKVEFIHHFRECWSEFADMDLKEHLDEVVSGCYQSQAEMGEGIDGVDIDNPSEFVCKYWE